MIEKLPIVNPDESHSVLNLQDNLPPRVWNFPFLDLKTQDGNNLVLKVLSGKLILYQKWQNDRPSISVRTFSASIQTNGWYGNGLGFSIYFWKDQKIIDTWDVGSFHVPCHTQDSFSFDAGGISTMNNTIYSSFDRVTYDVGGGNGYWWQGKC